MIASPARVTLLVLCVGVLATRTDADERPEPKFRPEYTAFPDLKPPERVREVTNPDGTVRREVAPGIPTEFPTLPSLPADAPLIRKVQYEQARAGLDYLEGTRLFAEILGYWNPDTDRFALAMSVFPLAAEFETKLANRVMWYEARVRLFKWVEWITSVRVRNGQAPPQSLNVIRFYRLATEIELLELLAEIERAGPAPAPPPMILPQTPGEVIVRIAQPKRAIPLEQAPPPRRIYPSGYTAFPDLKWDGPRPLDRREETPETRYGFPPADLPALPANASPLRKLQHEAALEAFAFLDEVSPIRAIIGRGPILSFEFGAETYRLAADLETKPANRVAWYEARVRVLKAWERLTETRVEIGTKPIYAYPAVLFASLQAEVDLIRLNAQVTNTGVAKGEAGKREEVKIAVRAAANAPPSYTAFPDIKGPTREAKQLADGTTVYEWKGVVPRPKLPALRADDALLRKLRFEQASEGLEYIDRIHQGLLESPFYDWFGHPRLLAATYRVAAELDDGPARRVPWHEQHVRDCKRIEQFAELRVRNGTMPPEYLAYIRIFRLQAETELLKLKVIAEESR